MTIYHGRYLRLSVLRDHPDGGSFRVFCAIALPASRAGPQSACRKYCVGASARSGHAIGKSAIQSSTRATPVRIAGERGAVIVTRSEAQRLIALAHRLRHGGRTMMRPPPATPTTAALPIVVSGEGEAWPAVPTICYVFLL